jgi:ketosteroid isomerase-like protein
MGYDRAKPRSPCPRSSGNRKGPSRKYEDARNAVRTKANLLSETVVRNHLQAFLEQKGIDAILNDYDENARFYSEAKIYQGKQEIRGFFMDFIGSLPAGAIDHFSLRSLRVDGNIAYITWNVGTDIPMGTDTFVVRNGKIVSQTFAMYAVPDR